MWVSRKELNKLKDRITELEYSNNVYVGVGQKFTPREILGMIIKHLELEFYKPDCSLKIVKKGEPKEE